MIPISNNIMDDSVHTQHPDMPFVVYQLSGDNFLVLNVFCFFFLLFAVANSNIIPKWPFRVGHLLFCLI